ncbi:MAG: M20/M25/M40 family metallo-hydrolase [Pseudomonadota bacterium]
MKQIILLAIVALYSLPGVAETGRDSAHAQKSLEIYSKLISIPTVAGQGKVPEMAEYLAEQLSAVGFAEEDITIIPSGETVAMIVRFRGDGSSGKKPILLLGHMDVVEALPEDWERPPFELTQDDTFFYGRGTIDNKYGITMLVSTFIHLKQEGFIPHRDLFLVFTGDEETEMITTRMLANERPELADAEFALNSDAGGGSLRADGKPLVYAVQAAEKTYASFELTVRNPGGHSSRPRADNAIYELALALGKIQNHQFPVMATAMTRDFFRASGQQRGGELGEAMIRFADDPEDRSASDRLAQDPAYVGATRTTCVATMIEGGHAENALPQSATATVNCRIFPGVAVADVETRLKEVVENEAIEFVLLDEPVASPISEPREDVMAAIAKAVHPRYPGLTIMPYMESGGTDGMHFRKAGIPTWAVSGVFMNPANVFAHGLNERLPKKAFYDGLEHWIILLEELAGRPGDE